MTEPKTQRVRDPIHNLIVFDEKDDVDRLAWRLINTPEFQRLRRIRQLGVSEFVFPGATHTRFAHSLGVYFNARRLLRLIDEHLLDHADEAPLTESSRGPSDRAVVIRLAALLHDIGHGPFSHAFEGARRDLAKVKGQEKIKNHEFYSAELIRHPDSGIYKVLSEFNSGLPQQIAEVIEADNPTDIYHAVVSSSFDADRLDYLQRDRYMTGTEAGAIDIEWLVNNLVIEQIPLSREEADAAPTLVPTFAFAEKARSAAEDFLLARYRLFTNVYMHKATRGFEQLLSALIRWLGTADNADRIGIGPDHPLIDFLIGDGEGNVEGYGRLDDYLIWGLLERLSRCSEAEPSRLAQRLLNRRRPKCLDLSRHFGNDLRLLPSTDNKMDKKFRKSLGRTVFRDAAPISLYKEPDGSPAKEHKRIRVRTKTAAQEITSFRDTIISDDLKNEQNIIRYYFFEDAEYETANRILTEGR